jgi:glycosyltransferase involved in cell wall biosynthesis
MQLDVDRKVLHCLSVLIPVYNEKFTVEQLVDTVLQVSLPGGMRKELILVDDASTDGTQEVLEDLVKRKPGLRLIRHSVNQGKGAAVRTAIKNATGDVIVVQDADLEYDPNDYGKLLGPILSGDADVVYGSRFLSSDRRRVLYFWHSLGNLFLTSLSNMFTNLNLTDMETCYKMARASLLKSIPLRCNRFGIEPELTSKFAKRDCRIYEVPVNYRGRSYGEGKKITWRDGIKALGIIVYFAFVDDIYEEKHGHSTLYRLSKTPRFNRWLADTLRPWVGESVLEIGAGFGNLTQQILPRKSYTVADSNPFYLVYLTNRFSGNKRVSVTHANVESESDFHGFTKRFDTVVCLSVIDHVEHDLLAIQNIFRALRSGGRVCLLVPRDPKLFGSFHADLGHFRRYTENECREKLERAGFVVESLFTFNRVGILAWFIPGKVLRREKLSRLSLKVFDLSVGFWRFVDRFLPWKGVSIIAIARKP